MLTKYILALLGITNVYKALQLYINGLLSISQFVEIEITIN